MSTIQAMAIMGIRAFDPEEPSYIKFYSPLTLIVGENGCGKTTIIECLKYVCTGELPPNSKGGAFVNDPRLSGLQEVKAQIKLKFHNVNNESMICTRSIAVTLKKSSITQRTIDSSLLRHDRTTNESVSISSRCADMDAELPIHLGVPKAILENVVFCHQEESNWPFSEPSVLKKKFDDIFSSKKYQVALDSIKSLRKEHSEDVGVGNARLDALKADTEKAKKIRVTMTEMNQQVQAKSQSLQTIEQNMTQITEELQRLNGMFRDIDLTEDQIQQIVNKRDFYQSTLNSLEAHITPRSESSEELKKMLEEYRASQVDADQEKKQILLAKSRLESQLKRIQHELAQKHLQMGRLEAAREQHEAQLQARVEFIEKANQEHGLNLLPEDGEKTLSVLKKKLKFIELKTGSEKKEATILHASIQDDLQVLKSQLMSIDESKKIMLNRIEQDKHQINTIEMKIQQYKVSALEIDSTEKKIEEYENRLTRAKETNNVDASQEELTKKEKKLREFDEKVSELNDELATLSKQGDIRAKLSLKRTDRDSRTADMTRLYNGCIRDVEKLLGFKPDIETFENELFKYKTDKEKKLRLLIEKRNTSNRELSAAEAKLNMIKQNLKTKNTEANEYQRRVEQVCGDKSVPDELKITQTKIEQIKERSSNLNAVDLVYDKYINGAKSGKCCPLCVREFNDDPEFQEFYDKLVQKQKNFPTLKEQLAGSLEKYNTRLVKLQSVQGSWIRLESIRKDIATMEATVKSYTEGKEKAAKSFELASSEQIDVDDQKIKADRLLIVAGNVSRILRETRILEEEIEGIETELSLTGSTRTISDCQKDLEEVGDQSKNVRRDIKRIHADLENARRVTQAIENSIRDSREKLLGLQHKRDFKYGLELQLKELKDQMKDHNDKYNSYEADINPITDKIQETTRKYEAAIKNWRTKEEAAFSEERIMSRIVERLEEYNNGIMRSESATSPARIDQVKKEANNLEDQIKSIKNNVQESDERLAIIEKDEADRRGVERDLQDQVRYRQTEIDLQNCDKDLDELEGKQTGFDRATLKRDLLKYQSEESVLIDKRGGIKGELAQLNDQIKRYEKELATDYDNVDGRYGRLYVEVKTNELSIKDLDTFSKVLQKSIMEYHSLKMNDLNKIIKELWVKTYRGGDIEYIAIRADNEGAAANRSFNYRVVMFQQGSELNMRGRCSAGQKVLASIIIRLALAETFCVNCGIFTLDEPTTNLDKSNVTSLAENLKDIIESRRDQANFQIVIITHDEEFAKCLGGANTIGKYYKMSKEDGMHSTIKEQADGSADTLGN